MITAVIPTLNSERFVGKCLDSLMRYYPDPISQIIVVDGGSTDKTLEVVRRYAVEIVVQRSKGLSMARNEGILKAKNNYVFFLDSDAYLGKIDFDKILRVLSNDYVGIVSLEVKTPITGKIARYIDNIRRYGQEKIKREGAFSSRFAGSSFIIKKGIGYFDPRHTYGADDTCMAYRVVRKGYKIAWLFNQDVYHYARNSILEYMKEQYGWARGSKVLIFEYSEYRSLTYVLKTIISRLLSFVVAIRLLRYGLGTCLSYIAGQYAWLLGFLRGL